MSHTGSVIHPNQSPGVIRMITLGYALTKDRDLVFTVPPEKKESLKHDLEIAREKADDPKLTNQLNERIEDVNWINCVQERFVIFPGTDKNYKYGDPVRFNLELLDSAKWKDFKYDLKELRDAIPEGWIDEAEKDKFKFRYIATEIKRLPKKFVLFPLYRFIGDMERNTANHVLMNLRKLGQEELHDLGFKIHPGRKIRVGRKNRSYEIKSVRIIGYEDFKENFENDKLCLKKDFKNHYDVEREIDKNGQHFISTRKEIPTWERV